MARPKRLIGINYTGFAAYFVTSCTRGRQKAFLNHDFCEECRDALLAASRDFGFMTTAYCFMPDHVHNLVEATREDASLTAFVAKWKQKTGFAWSKRTGAPLSFARYVVENPVRAKLVREVRDYPWVGSDRYSIDEIVTACQLDLKTGWHR